LIQTQGRGKKGEGLPQLAITPDTRTNSIIVAGDPVALMMIDQVKATVDVPPGDVPPSVDLVEVNEGTDVLALVEMVEQAINEGEQQRAQAQQGYKPKLVTLRGDQPRKMVLVSGSPSKFEEVRRLIEAVQGPPDTTYETRIIDIGDIAPADLEHVLNLLLYPEGGGPAGAGASASPRRSSGRPSTSVRRTSSGGSRSRARSSTPSRGSRVNRASRGSTSRTRSSAPSRGSRGTSVRNRSRGAAPKAAPARK